MIIARDEKGQWEYLDKPKKKRGRPYSDERVARPIRATFRMTRRESLMLDDLCKKTGMNSSDVIREALYAMDFDLRRFSGVNNDGEYNEP